MSAVGPAPASNSLGLRGRVADFSSRHRSLSVIIGMVIVATLLPVIVLLPPFNGFSGQSVWMDGFTNAGVFILLALGLHWIAVVNIVNRGSGSVLRATQHSEVVSSKKSDIPAESQFN